MAVIKVRENIKSCFLRGGPLDLKVLRTRTPAEKWLKEVKAGASIEVKREVARKGNFVQFELAVPVAGESYWFIFEPYWILPKKEEKVPAKVGGDGLPVEVRLKVKYLSQLDNKHRPYVTCNVTSLATVMVYYGHPAFDSTGKQLEDHLFELCERKGLDRHNHWHLKELIEGFGYKDSYQENAKWLDAKKWLAAGNLCILAGYFTPGGHILVLTGYNEKGFIVSDPFGIWYYDKEGNHYYDTSRAGAGITYPYQELIDSCGPDGDLWIHYISK